MAKLTKYEKETIVLFNEGEDTAHIQTYNAGLRNRLAAFSKKHPDLCRFSYNHLLPRNTYIPVLYRPDRQHWQWQTVLFLWIIDSDESDNIPSYSSPCGSSPRCIAFKSASSSANSRSFASAASARPRTIS